MDLFDFDYTLDPANLIWCLALVELVIILFQLSRRHKNSKRVLQLEDEMVWNHHELITNMKKIRELENQVKALSQKLEKKPISNISEKNKLKVTTLTEVA